MKQIRHDGSGALFSAIEPVVSELSWRPTAVTQTLEQCRSALECPAATIIHRKPSGIRFIATCGDRAILRQFATQATDRTTSASHGTDFKSCWQTNIATEHIAGWCSALSDPSTDTTDVEIWLFADSSTAIPFDTAVTGPLQQWVKKEILENSTAVETTDNTPQTLPTASQGPETILYEQLLAATNQMVYIVDEQGIIRVVSSSLAEQLGYDVTELRGKPLSAILSPSQFKTAVQIQTQLREHAQHNPAEPSPITSRTFVLKTTTGEELPVEVEVTLLPLDGSAGLRGTVGVVRDISELKATREQLTAERDRFRELYEGLPDPIVELQFRNGRSVIRSVNSAFEEVFGYTEKEVQGQPTNEFIVPDTQKAEAELIDISAAQGEAVSREVIRETTAGVRTFLLRSISFAHSEEQRGFAVYTDITERRNRERYHEVLNRILRHNLRNDLNVVLGIADQLARQDPTETETVDTLTTQLTDRIMGLAETSREARQLESIINRQGPTNEPIDIAALTTSICESFSERYPAADIHTDAPSHCIVSAGNYLETALTHLLENAIEHNPCSQPYVEANVTERESDVLVNIKDNGPGIHEDERQVLAGDKKITQLNHTSGLGLWIVKWTVESYGGVLTFDCHTAGTTVKITLPKPALA